MRNERLRKRLKEDRPSTTITLRIPVDVVESLKAVAPAKGFSALPQNLWMKLLALKQFGLGTGKRQGACPKGAQEG